ncbi:hypothetical protein Pelo_3475 [Pelomyxa schiedti]|nr:hypothetical protein Pelo_3475 [Pelomyxa schiedti]
MRCGGCGFMWQVCGGRGQSPEVALWSAMEEGNKAVVEWVMGTYGLKKIFSGVDDGGLNFASFAARGRDPMLAKWWVENFWIVEDGMVEVKRVLANKHSSVELCQWFKCRLPGPCYYLTFVGNSLILKWAREEYSIPPDWPLFNCACGMTCDIELAKWLDHEAYLSDQHWLEVAQPQDSINLNKNRVLSMNKIGCCCRLHRNYRIEIGATGPPQFRGVGQGDGPYDAPKGVCHRHFKALPQRQWHQLNRGIASNPTEPASQPLMMMKTTKEEDCASHTRDRGPVVPSARKGNVIKTPSRGGVLSRGATSCASHTRDRGPVVKVVTRGTSLAEYGRVFCNIMKASR